MPDPHLNGLAEEWLRLDKDPDSSALIKKVVDEGWDLELARDLLGKRLQFGKSPRARRLPLSKP